jgi:CO/xanthine dehydrogenase Mo-binding subunit
MSAPSLPGSLVDNPRLDRWIKFLPDRTVRVATGKVEIGQGVVTALRQIAADELDMPLERVVVLSGDTTEGPDEMYTTSSLSISMSGGSLRLVCAEVRAKAIERAALRLNCSPQDLIIDDGRFVQSGKPTEQDYWTVANEIDLTQKPTGSVAPKPASSYRFVGQSTPRIDLPAKLTSGAFIHDVRPENLLHARMLRQPNPGATLASFDEAAIKRAAKGDLQIVRDANFVAFVSPTESAPARQMEQPALHRAAATGGRLAERPAGRGAPHRCAGARDAAQERRALHRVAALYRARLDGALLRPGRVQGRPSHGLVARPRHASLAQESRTGAGAAPRSHHGASSAWRRLLRP